MPLVTDEIIEKGGRLLIWQLTETEEELNMFPPNRRTVTTDFVEKIKNPPRRKQKLATNILLSFLGDKKETELGFTPEGKPFFKNKAGTISFSGCKKYVALLFHESAETGIDIEEKREKILRIANKFVNQEEWKWIRKKNEMEDLHLIWGAKESAFKLIGGGGIDFKNNLLVEAPSAIELKEGKGNILFSKHLPAKEIPYYYRYLEDYILVYTIVKN